ncbi:unnamed protein product [Ectocarpus sp. 13 AM-2016]
MDVLLKRGRFKDSDHTKDKDGVAEWAPRQFLCPITQGLMMDPVVAQDGHSYERHAILEWFAVCRTNSRPPTSPMTSAAVHSESVTSNHALKGRIQDWVLEANSAEDQGTGVSVGKGKGKQKHRDGSGTAGLEPLVNKIKIEVRYGSKRYNVTVDRNDVFHGIERLKTFVSRKKALESITRRRPR